MKTIAVPSHVSSRAGRASAAALLSVSFGLLAVSAQTSNVTGTDTAGPTGTNPGSTAGTVDRSNPAGTGIYDTANADESSLKHSDKRFLTKAAKSGHRELALSQLAAQRATNPQVRDFAQQLVSRHQQMNQQVMQLARQKGVTLDSERDRDRIGTTGANTAFPAGVGNAAGVGSSSDQAHTSGANPGLGRPAGTHPSDGPAAGTAATMSTDATGGSGAIAAMSDRHYRNLSEKTGAEFDQEYISLMVDEHEDDLKLFQKAVEDAKDPDIRAFASKHVAALQTHLDHASTLTKSVAE